MPSMAVMVKVAVNVPNDALTTYSPVFVPRVKARVAVPFMVCVVVAASTCVVRVPTGSQLMFVVATELP